MELVEQRQIRVLVTGSRTWEDADEIGYALLDAYNHFGPFTLVSGACPQGADRIAEQIVEDWGLSGMEIERHPADWEKYGKRAGFIRNQEMVDSGIDFCLAFIRRGSKGASHTARIAKQAGIPTKEWRRP